MARNPQPSPTGDGDEVDDPRENDEGDAQDFDSFRSWLDGLYANAPLPAWADTSRPPRIVKCIVCNKIKTQCN